MSPTDMLSDAQARLRALATSESFIVQAPAGSGKTTLLTQRYLALLACSTRPEAVIAITFTQKAAAEMRHRVLDALARARGHESPQHPADADTLRLAETVLARADSSGWPIETQPGRLRIQTIDALNRWLSERLPILSRTGVTLAVEPRPAPLYALAALRTLRSIDRPGALAEALKVVLAHLDHDASRCQSLLADMLHTRERWLPAIATGVADDDLTYRRRMEEILAHIVGQALTALDTHLQTLGVDAFLALVIGAAQRLQASVPEYAALARLTPASRPRDVHDLAAWQALAALLLTKEGAWRKRITVKEGFDKDHPDKRAFVGWLTQLSDDERLRSLLVTLRRLPPARYPEPEWQVVRALHQVLLSAASELRVVFAERRVVDFVEIAQSARLSLGTAEEPTDLAIALDERIEHVLVDEFQDTSNAQVQLLSQLTIDWSDGDGRTLFLVGDPMQSIYGFREANVSRFLAIQRQGLGAVRLTPLRLTRNFRSRPELVTWFNDAFSVALPRTDDLDRGAVSYTPAIAARTATDQKRVELCVCDNGTPSDEAAAVLTVIRESQSANPDARIAVLARTRSQLAPVASLLLREAVPFHGVDLVPLTERLAVRDLISLTRAILHPADRIAWLACLRAPWCGLPLAALEVLAGNADTRTIWQQLTDDAVLAQLTPEDATRAGAFRDILQSGLTGRGENTLAACIEGTWRALNGPATLTDPSDLSNAEMFFQRLGELEHAGDIEDPTQLEASLADLYAAPSQTPATVQLLTIHRAKGLEWDIVILTGLGRIPRQQDRHLLEWLEFNASDTDSRVLMAPHRGRSRAASDDEPLERWLRAQIAERTLLEVARLLYVAATRARERLWLVFHGVTDANGELAPPRSGTLLAPLWPAIASDASHLVMQRRTTDAEPLVLPAVSAEAMPARLHRLATVGATRRLQAAPVAPDTVGPLEFEFEWVTASARHVGTLVHEELERIATGRLSLETGLSGREPHWRRRLRELGVGRERLDDGVARTARALSRTAADARGRWVLSNTHREASAELDLSTIRAGRVRAARIDRSFVDEAGTRWIIDFKTSLHEGNDLEGFLDQEQLRYRAQLEHYAMLLSARGESCPIRLGLYFPMHGAWREWAFESRG